MAKEMLIQILCDRHLRQEQRRVLVDAEPAPITLEGVTRVLTLCPECAALRLPLADWAAMLRECGTRVEDEARPPSAAARRALADSAPVLLDEQFRCPIEGCIKHQEPYARRSGLLWHVKHQHQTTLAELEGGRRRSAEEPKTCPWPGCGEVFKSGGGLSSHLRSHHGATTARAS